MLRCVKTTDSRSAEFGGVTLVGGVSRVDEVVVGAVEISAGAEFAPLFDFGAGALEKGVDACVASWNRVAPNTIPAVAKIAGNYLGGQLIKMEALLDDYDEAIALGPDGMISEGSGQNVFAVSQGVLYTPPVDGTLLPGITRDTVVTIAKDLGIEVRVQPLARETLYTSDEIFLSGTATEVAPVRSVDKIPVGDGKPGPVAVAIAKRYLDVVHGRVADAHGWLTHTK